MGSASTIVESGFDAIFASQSKKQEKQALADERYALIKKANLDKEIASKEFQIKQEKEESLLKKSLSSSRAKFGSNQITNASLSSQAVLKGINDEAQKTLQDNTELFDLETAKLDQALDSSLTQNLNKKRQNNLDSNYEYYKEGMTVVKSLTN